MQHLAAARRSRGQIPEGDRERGTERRREEPHKVKSGSAGHGPRRNILYLDSAEAVPLAGDPDLPDAAHGPASAGRAWTGAPPGLARPSGGPYAFSSSLRGKERRGAQEGGWR